MKSIRVLRILRLTCFVLPVFAEPLTKDDVVKDEILLNKMTSAVKSFINSLSAEQKTTAMVTFKDTIRFDWNYTPRARKGLTFKNMNPEQEKAVSDLLKLVLSAEGYKKTEQIVDLENVLRVIETRPKNDTYRDPENYAILIYGEPGNDPWGWRFEGHHISLHFSSINGKLTYTPGFLGSNPGTVLADVPQKGRRILKDEQDLAFDLLHSFDKKQLEKVVLNVAAPNEILTTNSRKASLDKMEGITMGEMTAAQKALFKKLIMVYLDRYHVTLKNQQWKKLEKLGIEKIQFAWMGDQTPLIGQGHGHYYRIHGPEFLIEFDNTQNGGNHIHSVVRDLNNDFGEDMLKLHYEKAHRK